MPLQLDSATEAPYSWRGTTDLQPNTPGIRDPGIHTILYHAHMHRNSRLGPRALRTMSMHKNLPIINLPTLPS